MKGVPLQAWEAVILERQMVSGRYALPPPEGIVQYPWVAGERVEKMKND